MRKRREEDEFETKASKKNIASSVRKAVNGGAPHVSDNEPEYEERKEQMATERPLKMSKPKRKDMAVAVLKAKIGKKKKY